MVDLKDYDKYFTSNKKLIDVIPVGVDLGGVKTELVEVTRHNDYTGKLFCAF